VGWAHPFWYNYLFLTALQFSFSFVIQNYSPLVAQFISNAFICSSNEQIMQSPHQPPQRKKIPTQQS